jgi:hypothetical protein
MTFLAKFERNFLFGLTRSLAMFFIISTLATLIISGLAVGISQLSKDDTKVTPQEVIDSLKPALSVEAKTQTPKHLPAELKLPSVLQAHFSEPYSLQELNNWLNDMPKNQQQAFLDEMAAVVVFTHRKNEHIYQFEVINIYHRLKMQKLATLQLAESGNAQTWLWYAGALGTGIIIIALFSLILFCYPSSEIHGELTSHSY